MVCAPAPLATRYAKTHASLFGELERVRQQILEYLLQPLGVGDQAAREVRVGVHFETKPPVLGLVTERARDHIQQTREEDLLGLHRDRTGFDLDRSRMSLIRFNRSVPAP